MLIDNLTFGVCSDLKLYGHTDDGQPYIGEVFYVAATDARGNRWRHAFNFDGVKVEHDEFGDTFFLDTRDAARKSCERIIERVLDAQVINAAYWYQTRPVYGSQAYIEYGAYEDMEWERENS